MENNFSESLPLPKDVLWLILYEYLDAQSWVNCLIAHRNFHILTERQACRKYSKLLFNKKLEKWSRERTRYFTLVISPWAGGEFNALKNRYGYKEDCCRYKGFCPHCGDIFRLDVLKAHAERCLFLPRTCQACKKFSLEEKDGPGTAWKLFRHEQECNGRLWCCKLCHQHVRQDHRKCHLANECRGASCHYCLEKTLGVCNLNRHWAKICPSIPLDFFRKRLPPDLKNSLDIMPDPTATLRSAIVKCLDQTTRQKLVDFARHFVML
jgi:hypothetical protein